jgi:hypothetical protein
VNTIGASGMKKVDPATQAAIQAFLENGGQITKVPMSCHGACERRKGIQFRGKDPELVRQETHQAAEMAQRRREWIDSHGGLKMVRECGIAIPDFVQGEARHVGNPTL